MFKVTFPFAPVRASLRQLTRLLSQMPRNKGFAPVRQLLHSLIGVELVTGAALFFRTGAEQPRRSPLGSQLITNPAMVNGSLPDGTRPRGRGAATLLSLQNFLNRFF
jgi:hypothetical protein